MLLRYFAKLDYNIIIKNHPFIDEGQDLPVGQEEEYTKALEAIDKMENEARKMGFIIAPRRMNIIELFTHSKAEVAVSDVSSCLLEFLPLDVPLKLVEVMVQAMRVYFLNKLSLYQLRI